MNKIKAISIVGSMFLAMFALTGCPGPQPQDEVKSEVSVLFTASELAAAAKAYVVPAGDIARLLVSVDDVMLTPAGDAGIPVSVLGAPQVVDLKELLGVAALLNRPEIPVGTYSNMQLLLSSATLYLTSAPDTAITAVSMPDNGIFDVPVDITIVEGEQNKVLVDLGGITLVELNDGSYELTPDFQVRVPDAAEPIPARSSGEVKQLDLVNGFYVAERHDALVTVYFSNAVIYLPSDGTSPTGVPEDIFVGDHVLAYGTLSADGAVDAAVVIILRGDDDHGGDDGHGGNHGGRDDDEGEDEGDDDGGHHGDDEGEHEGIEDSGHHGGDDDGSVGDDSSSDDDDDNSGSNDDGDEDDDRGING